MKKILVVDNRDSFVYNLVEMLRVLRVECNVIEVDEIVFPFDISSYSGIILSPGAGVPSDYPNMMHLLHLYHKTTPFLGICLGCQAIAEYFGADIKRLNRPLHGHLSELRIAEPLDVIFDGINTNSAIGRYHSWIVEKESLRNSLICIATDEEDNLMTLKHYELIIYGFQFHPESIITEQGYQLLLNWLRLTQ